MLSGQTSPVVQKRVVLFHHRYLQERQQKERHGERSQDGHGEPYTLTATCDFVICRLLHHVDSLDGYALTLPWASSSS